ncbi:MAG: nucleotidyl transferase AbiEii/AbiGii toxin family protein [Tepidanaerobacter acetatoxydans]|uniref:nucleotidyl transferase AbiEii/AbiGii toxin family protein n=1 Tax=Tepidanaerobacter TaxID=499228 RepID=UPI000A567A72|nr:MULTISPECIES: nucleotidyl transferase AbiEii/AbiGii toxin family protein [Tepidanaerobacter]NLU10058.1 nucleotidyl transferase AbiEii/AbiGii toxin family protein [Tepidanaerobacter acetatoxydans]
MGNIAASVLARLKNKSKEQGIPLQQLLNLFCQEEFIRRLSESNYKENLILKGGFLLYSISGFTTRPTVDADYLLKNYSNDLYAVEKLVKEVISSPSKNDFVEFEIRNLDMISEIKRYHGIRASLIGIIGRTRTPFNIDFGVGDIIIPSPVKRTLPVILPEFEKPEVLTYSLESTVAEKLDAIIVLMEATGRMKDFYDIYYLATTFDFEGRKLQEAIYETLSNRGTPYEKDSVAVISRLAEDSNILKRWDNFCKKILKYKLDFNHVIKVIIDFLQPPYEALILEDELFEDWSHEKKGYV